MNKKIITTLFSVVLVALPAAVLAFSTPDQPTTPISSMLDVIDRIVGFIWPLFIGLAILMFIYAGFMFLTARGEAGKIATARTAVVWGVIGLAVGIISAQIPFIVNKVLYP
jgi:hypothetical protein